MIVLQETIEGDIFVWAAPEFRTTVAIPDSLTHILNFVWPVVIPAFCVVKALPSTKTY